MCVYMCVCVRTCVCVELCSTLSYLPSVFFYWTDWLFPECLLVLFSISASILLNFYSMYVKFSSKLLIISSSLLNFLSRSWIYLVTFLSISSLFEHCIELLIHFKVGIWNVYLASQLSRYFFFYCIEKLSPCGGVMMECCLMTFLYLFVVFCTSVGMNASSDFQFFNRKASCSNKCDSLAGVLVLAAKERYLFS